MNLVLRGVRVIDPLGGIDMAPGDVWLRDGAVVAIDSRVDAEGAELVDLTPGSGAEPVVVCPGFIDLHAHLREPGGEESETLASGARAAAAGGFTQVVAMANTAPPVDRPAAVAAAVRGATGLPVSVLPAAAMTVGLDGAELVDVAGCAASGAVAFTDDGRNAAPATLLAEALTSAWRQHRAVLVHPEDEATLAARNPGARELTRCTERAADIEESAVRAALGALQRAATGHLHLQHLSAAGSLNALREARERGLAVSAEVTPHHLALTSADRAAMQEPSLAKVNPPLRDASDREAMISALLEGLVDAVATDHAPHRAADKGGDYAAAAPGMIGLETAFAVCVTHAGLGGRRLARLIEALTAGPWRALGAAAGLHQPRLRGGDAADLVVLDPGAEWIVGTSSLRSLSQNTPLLGTRLRGRVLMTVAGGVPVHVVGEGRLAGVLAEHARA